MAAVIAEATGGEAVPWVGTEQHPWLCPEVGAVTDWLIEQGLQQAEMTPVVQGFCERLQCLGMPLWRGYVSARTLHPRIVATGHIWRRGEGSDRDEYEHTVVPTDAYMKSPFAHMEQNGLSELRIRLDRDDVGRFPLLAEFKAAGGSDYFAQMVGIGEPRPPFRTIGVVASWTSDAPDGFNDAQIAILRHLMPRFALALGSRLGHEISVNLLDTYLGPEAGRRVLAGEIRRGSLEVISAAILYADFRGFTRIADSCERTLLVDMLNAYFDCLVPIIHAHGGQVLKFLGDGLLATFADGDDGDAGITDERAIAAAAEAVRCIRELSEERQAAGEPVMELDLALHRGDVFFGNVGSADRLDFTVIGPAVNETSRIEALCSQHDCALLLSEAFAEGLSSSQERLVSIGRFRLRGVGSPQTIYTLDGL